MRIGIHTLEITPPFPMPMGGFGSRLDHADGTHDPLLLTAIYMEEKGSEAWLVAADLIQFPDGSAFETGIHTVAHRLGVEPHALFLNASHTHGSPQMNDEIGIASPAELIFLSPQNRTLIKNYHTFLWEKLAMACEKAKQEAKEGRFVYGEGTTTFPMNRRAKIGNQIENAPNPTGPMDDRLRLLGIEDADGKLRALGLILAAHPTSVGARHQFSADYVGAWRRAFQCATHHAITPFFLQGCGGDARPAFTQSGDRWRQVAFEELPVMGEHLLRETMEILNRGCTPFVAPKIQSAVTHVHLACQELFSQPDSCRELLQSDKPQQQEFARECLRRFDKGEKLPHHVSLTLSYLQIDKKLSLLGMSCEPLCAMGRHIEKAIPHANLIVLGYTNGCFGYLPDTQELLRGGYESEFYQFLPLSGPFLPESEEILISEIKAFLAPILER